ncbi:MAG: GNAT family N-acetyltransferase [Alphaproteobacteria bacterium]|nr:GNAT family N-acetyltransferase [Alphaproteobacteria bacterium]
MQIVEYYKSQNQEYWRSEIGKGDWSAAKLLWKLLDKNELKKMCGSSTEVFLLTEGENLMSFAILAEQDEVEAPELSPWIGFVYTFPQYRGKHCAGELIEHICGVLKNAGEKQVYISTEEIGLYEKYGFVFWQMMITREGKPTRVYVRKVE